MIKTLLYGLVALSLFSPLSAMDVKVADGLSTVEVFTAGEAGYPHFRIPTIVTTKKGTILAFAEARFIKDDHGRNDIVLKRSTDNGQTWSKLIVIHADKELVMVNPSPVVLKNDKVLLIYETFPHGYHARVGRHHKMMDDGYGAERTQRLLMVSSKDEGKTWSKARDLTKVARAETKIIQAGSPANGIQLKKGKYKGRIVMPLFLTQKIDSRRRTWQNAVLYSDDNAKTWKRGEYVPHGEAGACNETTIAELSNGDIIMNARPGRAKMRAVSTSKDGGVSWTAYKWDKTLAGRTCNIGLLRHSYKKNRLIFCNNFNNSNIRKNGTMRISYDDGKTWAVKKQLVPGLFGYCQLTKLKNGDVGIIYEPFHSPREEWSLHFMKVPIKWLEAK